MEQTKNLCAQIPVSLHTRVRQEQEESGKNLSEYITEVLTQSCQRLFLRSVPEKSLQILLESEK